jgi:hypothetical protein
MVVFFVLAGASLDLRSWIYRTIGNNGVVIRNGAWLRRVFRRLYRQPTLWFNCGDKKWMGLALLPQAGVPIDMALVVATQFPEHRQMLISMVISSTVLFDIIGPILTRYSISQAGKVE